MMQKETDLGTFRRYIMPVLAIICSLFMVIAAFYAHSKEMAGYIVIFIVVMLLGKILNTAKYRKE
jgi:APA family basic amino acid/polyamine antiporter